MARHPECSARRARTHVGLRVAGLALVVAVACPLAACTGGGSLEPADPVQTGTGSPTATSTAAPTPSAPALLPDASAVENLPFFSSIVDRVWATENRAAGRAYIDALVKGGFDKAAMEVTRDTSTVGNPAESIQFAVRWQDECLVGQVGPATGEPYTVVVPVLAEGTCLVGDTRPIDW
ncbi:hypothetical protein ACFC1W_09300 [Microbacterium sp. NPDC056003]|uniref:DUF6993 domain-containing protein n=1 Tax=Microbacterium sp. NPDC056003 TaxID=3345676 RepID=UPI0035DB88AB